MYVAKAIVLTELFIAVGLWFRRTRYAAVWIAVGFHVSIEASAAVQVFSFLAIAALVIWAVPSTRDRTLLLDVSQASHQRLAALAHWLDWLARFQLVHGPPGSPVQTIDRDGVVRSGGPAVAHVFSRLPVTAWFALPLNYWLGRSRNRRRLEDGLPQSG